MKYRVIVLGLQAKRRKPYKSGDIIDDGAIEEGTIQQLIDEGRIRPIEEKEEKIIEVNEEASEEATEKLDITEITVKELKKYLDDKRVTYSPIAKKSDLYDLYKEN